MHELIDGFFYAFAKGIGNTKPRPHRVGRGLRNFPGKNGITLRILRSEIWRHPLDFLVNIFYYLSHVFLLKSGYWVDAVSAQATIAHNVAALFDEEINVKFSAYDLSTAGNLRSANIFHIKSPQALHYILGAPGDLGLARAYITGALEISGDFYRTLLELYRHIKEPVPKLATLALLKSVGPAILTRPPIPVEEALPRYKRGVLHSLARDKSAIQHHYDVSNEFYSMILGPTFVYSCAVFTKEKDSLEKAQSEKIDLICRKLDLRPGMRLLDIGCGWGSLVLHAAKEYGVKAVGVTLSINQAALASERIVKAKLTKLVEVRIQDYREIPENNFHAISSVGMSEHVGSEKMDAYFEQLRNRVMSEGRLLNHCIVRPHSRVKERTGKFFDRYIFPDGELIAPSKVAQSMIDAGFELRHSENLREHYSRTLTKWCENLVENWDDAVDEVGLTRARIWHLYMTLSRIGFETSNIQIHQFLGVVNNELGANPMPLRPAW